MRKASPLAHRSRPHHVWARFRRHKMAYLGLCFLLLVTILTLLGPMIWGLDPTTLDIAAKHQGPSLKHPMGTDQLGRDLFAAMMIGGRTSLMVGFIAMFLSLVLGTCVGMIAAVFKPLDGPLMRLTDLFLALPMLPLLLVVIMLWRDSLRAAFGPESGVFILVVCVISITSWMQTARIVRGEVLALKEREFILAAISLGAGPRHLIWQHILPNVLSPIFVSATLGFASAILTESALSFLGLGFPSDFPTWGRLLFDGTNYMTLTPARVIWPGLALSLTVLSVNYIGDGLRDAMDPRADTQ